MKIAVYYYKDKNEEIASLIKKEALNNGFVVDNENPDIVFSIGGDGTFLRAVHNYLNKLDKILFVGINSGTLGFYYDYNKDEISLLMKDIKENKYVIKEHTLLKADVTYQKEKETIYGLNEIRIENPFHTLIADVLINNEQLETFRGNGLVVSSPLGSSAYNKSLGGALIDHDIDAMELTEIAAIENNSYRSLGSSFVISKDKTITFKGTFNHIVIGYDHLNKQKEEQLENISISYSDKKARIIRSQKYSYINKIRKSFVL